MAQNVDAGLELSTKLNVHADPAMPGDKFAKKSRTIITLIKVII